MAYALPDEEGLRRIYNVVRQVESQAQGGVPKSSGHRILWGAPAGFTGNVYFKGVLFSLIGQTPLAFVHIVSGPSGSILVEYNAGPIILSYPGFEYWRVTANVYGDIYID